ncbi:hypothetical protein ILYODFUR_025175 [Ilyodon furcidens]|uniref:C-type lectin domain-containing protein n=1 Tax=Ilyodon furcidens TaxID=33524 RepID=A0ABV0UKA9_9TELE
MLNHTEKEEGTVYDEGKLSDSKGGLSSEKEAASRRRYCQTLACCLGTFCIILVLGIIVIVYKSKNENLTVENKELKKQNQELEGEKKTLKEQIENLQDTQNELNVSRAHWSIDAYCPKKTTERKCNPCQEGWITFQTSCYAYNNAKNPHQRSWDGAQENCREKASHLTVVANQQEKDHINETSPAETEINGCWIGLRAVQGKWK